MKMIPWLQDQLDSVTKSMEERKSRWQKEKEVQEALQKLQDSEHHKNTQGNDYY